MKKINGYACENAEGNGYRNNPSIRGSYEREQFFHATWLDRINLMKKK
jgi:hypothetical protein